MKLNFSDAATLFPYRPSHGRGNEHFCALMLLLPVAFPCRRKFFYLGTPGSLEHHMNEGMKYGLLFLGGLLVGALGTLRAHQ